MCIVVCTVCIRNSRCELLALRPQDLTGIEQLENLSGERDDD